MRILNCNITLKFIDILNEWIKEKTDIKIQSKQKYESIINNQIKLSIYYIINSSLNYAYKTKKSIISD